MINDKSPFIIMMLPSITICYDNRVSVRFPATPLPCVDGVALLLSLVG